MFLRAHKSIPVVSVFHYAKSAPSVRAVNLLKAAVGEGYPPGKPLSFNLDVVESAPNADQMSIISRYTSNPLSSFLSAHPTSSSSSSSGTAESMAQEFTKNPNSMRWPVVVDWDNGRAVVGDADRVKSVILEGLRKDRDGS